MTVKISSANDLAQDLARRYPALAPGDARRSPEIDADYSRLIHDGYVILQGLLDPSSCELIRAAVTPWLDKVGRNNFEGLKTQRIYDVLSKTRAIDRLVDHPRILGVLDKLFLPNYLLSQAQVINILPGEAAQPLHADDAFYRIPRPRAALGAATIWAIDAFTADNGATVIIPGSHAWGDRQGAAHEAIPALMPAGSVLVFLGTTWHGGGTNSSGAARLAVTCQYCEPYLRPQESFLLELNHATVARLSPELQALVGYSIHPPFMGMVDGKHPKRLLDSNNDD